MSKTEKTPVPAALSCDLLEKMDAYWRAANYLTVGQIYLQKNNPLLETPLCLFGALRRLVSRWLRWAGRTLDRFKKAKRGSDCRYPKIVQTGAVHINPAEVK